MNYLTSDAVDTGPARLRAPAARVERFRGMGVWRAGTLLTDLDRWRRETPDAIAVHARTAAAGTSVRLSYAEFAGHVERFAGALDALGVRPGEVVAVQLPNWWQTSALMLACLRTGALLAPVMPAIRPRELERMLRGTGAVVCVTADRWDGFEHAAALAEMAPRLPRLRHRVVLGERIADGETDFAGHFATTPWERTRPMPLGADAVDPDRVAVALFTSGTTGEPKAALHTPNTLYAGYHTFVLAEGYGPGDAFLTPHALTHSFGLAFGIGVPLATGGTAVLTDVWAPATALDLMAEADVTMVGAAPVFCSALAVEARRSGAAARLPALRHVMAPGSVISRRLVAEVAEGFGVALRNIWGMTEGGGTFTRAGDPDDWAAHSVGRPALGVDLDLRSAGPQGEVTAERPARLHVRGSSVCLATMARDSGRLTVLAEHDDGWYDTGDLAAPDGRGGVRVVGRAADRVGGALMIPVHDVETALLDRADVDDVAVVGYPDGHGGELACAVLVCPGPPPELAAVQDYLKDAGMTEWYWPSRVEHVPALPRTAFGKVRKELLKRWLRGEAELATE